MVSHSSLKMHAIRYFHDYFKCEIMQGNFHSATWRKYRRHRPPPKKNHTNKPAPDYSEIKMLFLIPTSNNFIIRMKSERKEWLFKYCELTNRPSNMEYFCAMCKGNSFDLLSRLDISSGPVARGHQKLMADHHFSKTDKFWWPDWATKIL